MRRYLLNLIVFFIISVVINLTLVRDSFAFRDGEDRDFRKITIVSPLGGETFVAGSKQKISWQTSSSIRYVKIEYSIDNGKQWIELVKNMKMDITSASSYEWEVPCIPTSKARIRISDVYGPDFDVILNPFSIICVSEFSKEN